MLEIDIFSPLFLSFSSQDYYWLFCGKNVIFSWILAGKMLKNRYFWLKLQKISNFQHFSGEIFDFFEYFGWKIEIYSLNYRKLTFKIAENPIFSLKIAEKCNFFHFLLRVSMEIGDEFRSESLRLFGFFFLWKSSVCFSNSPFFPTFLCVFRAIFRQFSSKKRVFFRAFWKKLYKKCKKNHFFSLNLKNSWNLPFSNRKIWIFRFKKVEILPKNIWFSADFLHKISEK